MASITDLQNTSEILKQKSAVFESFSSNQEEFDEAKTNIAKELSSVSDAISDAAGAMVAVEKNQDGKESSSSASNVTLDSLKVATASIEAIQDALTGDVSVKDMSETAKNIDEGYDALYQSVANINPEACNAFVEAYKESNPVLFETGSQIKNNASSLLSDTDKIMTGISGWGGSYGDPDEAINKINTNVQNIASGTASFAKTLQCMTDEIFKAMGLEETWIGHYLEDGVNISSNLGMAAASLTQAGASGIGSFYSAKAGIEALKHGNIASALGYFSSSISGTLGAGASVVGSIAKGKQFEETWDKDHQGQLTGSEPNINEEGNENSLSGENEDDASTSNSTSNETSKTNGSSGSVDNDFSADMIYEIKVILDGSSSSKNSCCVINGENYVLSGYSLSQELLQPMQLSFSLEKEDKTETEKDVVFANITQLIGKSLEINVTTIKTSKTTENPSASFVFKGMIIDVSASRATASAQSASVTAATWDSLLQNTPHCRSFENMTLKEIVDEVLTPYHDIKSNVSPRFKSKIPYIVQYDQSDYAFICMLAVRFGEWMYNTGDTFVFGELDVCDSSSANLEYPGGSLMSYSLHQNMASFSFSHLLPDYYRYGKDKGIQKTSAQGMVEGKMNDWTDKAYNASMQRFQDEQTVALKAGGFDSGKECEGADNILDYSLQIETLGKTTAVMTVQGFSKLAMLKIGQTFLIRDNTQNKSGENKDVEQQSLKVIGINHSFDYRQEYSNSFVAIPVTCSYPSYSDADVFAIAPQQRAKVVDNKDEQMLGRVRVQFPWQEIQSKNMKTPWLRIAVPYAGQSKGLQFVPEIGEEVMIGFEMNNAERPYVIGSFYNGGTGNPDEAWAVSQEQDGTSNNIKAIRTRSGHTILFNDKGEAGLIEIYDNKNNTYHITLSADDKKITICSAGEIEVVADTNINIVAKGNIRISADGDVGIKSKGSISMDANNDISIQASKVKVR